MVKNTIQTKECKNCGSVFAKASTCSRKEWNLRQGCSKSCAAKIRGAAWLDKYKYKPGCNPSPETQFKKGHNKKELNNKWKGDEATYAAKHIWMRTNYGSPQYCEHCFTTEDRMYHWANISDDYKRDRTDWLRLCVPCHKKYDISRRKYD